MKYWDEGNGRITDDSSYAPIVDGKGIYIETYELRNGARIDIAYTQETKLRENLYYYRESVLAQHNVKLNDIRRLVRLAIPSEKYKEIMEDEE
jgi:hypothetical protein